MNNLNNMQLTILINVLLSLALFIVSVLLYRSVKKNIYTKHLEFTIDSLNNNNTDLQNQLVKYKLKDISKPNYEQDACFNCDKVDKKTHKLAVMNVIKLKRDLHYKDVEIKCYNLLIKPHVDQCIMDDLITSIKDSVKYTSNIIIEEYKDKNQSKS